MLRNVHLSNLALIKEADFDFGPGLNILTGETGAGKSILIGSINIALGEKASKSFIRTGASQGLVELQFYSEDPRISELLKSMDIPEDDHMIIISRRITPEGSTCRINGVTVTLNRLRSITSLLVDIHGQHDHQSLLHSSSHLDIVDEFGKKEIRPIWDEFREGYSTYRSLRSRYRQFSQDPEELAREISLAEYECREIEEASLKPGEDTQLEEAYRKMGHAREITEGLHKVKDMLFDSSGSASSLISEGLRELNHLQVLDPDLSPLCSSLTDMESVARDLDHDLSRYIGDHEFDADSYQKIRGRLDELNHLKSKYGSTIDAVLAYRDRTLRHLQELTEYSSDKEALAREMDQLKIQVRACADRLSEARRMAAAELETRILENLKDLNFPDVRFEISFSRADKIYEIGYDKVEFLISTNAGEPIKPLIRVASGGELSRIMLAIKASIADADRTETLIFDEIDTGISGRTAQKVAEKLAVLSSSHQLICITHLPQIAAMADIHFGIEKSSESGASISGIRRLNNPDSILELARLISGSEITESTLISAEEMKKAAAEIKSGGGPGN